MEIKRRSAFKQPRKPSGHLTGTPTQLAICELLQTYRYLPTTYIKAWIGSGEYIENVLTDLVEKHYIGIPERAVNRCKTKAVPYVYELLSRGQAFLALHGRLGDRAKGGRGGGWFEHDFLISVIQYSFDIAPRAIAGLRVRSPQSILAHENCPETTRAHKTPFVIPTEPPLTADADPFGLELDGKLVFFHGFEADNHTETLATLQRKVDRYAVYLRQHMPTRMFGMLKNHMHILIVTTSEGSMANLTHMVPEDLADRFHFKTINGFHSKFPPPTAHMVLEPWHQKGGKTWSILNHLKGTSHELGSESQPRERAGESHQGR
jgi:hypothetical protein